jgi:glycosyltransferase involved in cell wall biosynthesis
MLGGVDVCRTASLRLREDTCTVPEMGLYCATSLLPTLRHVATWKPDVMHAHFAMPTGLLAWTVHRLTAVPYALTAHLGDVPGGVPAQTDRLFRIVAPLARCVWAGAAACTAVSSFVQELAERAYHRPVTRILNGIDLRKSETPHSRSEIPHLVFLGRFNPQKNAPFLIDALSRLRDLEWRLTMIGEGPDRGLVSERIAQHGLGDRVRLLGWLAAPEVQTALSAADILCLPSLSEGLPVAAIEALAHGLAIAGSDIPGLRDVLRPGVNGLAAPVNDVAAFAEILRSLVRDRALLATMQRASLELVRAFDLREVVEAYERILTAAASPRAC